MLATVATVILDEVHAVAAAERGTHLMTAVERLALLSGEVQRVALSATVYPPAAGWVPTISIVPLSAGSGQASRHPHGWGMPHPSPGPQRQPMAAPILAMAEGALYPDAMSYFSHSWLPYIYQYGLGGVIFVIGLWITLKSGCFDPARPKHRKWLVVLILGFVWYMVLHGAMTWAALGHERSAMIAATVVMAVSIAVSMVWFHKCRGAV